MNNEIDAYDIEATETSDEKKQRKTEIKGISMRDAIIMSELIRPPLAKRTKSTKR